VRVHQQPRSLLWIASSKKDYQQFPPEVQDAFGFQLHLVQAGQHPPSAKPLKGIASGVLELIEAFDGDAYRAVYTIRFDTAVYVLHAFQKKSKQGVKTPKADIDLIKQRLKDAEAHHASAYDKD
jgi:phage-related protein